MVQLSMPMSNCRATHLQYHRRFVRRHHGHGRRRSSGLRTHEGHAGSGLSRTGGGKVGNQSERQQALAWKTHRQKLIDFEGKSTNPPWREPQVCKGYLQPTYEQANGQNLHPPPREKYTPPPQINSHTPKESWKNFRNFFFNKFYASVVFL